MSKRRISNKEIREIAEARMSILLSLAEDEGLAGNLDRSKRYFRLAKAISMRTNTPMPEGVRYCRACSTLLFPGRNCRVRLRSGKIIVHCLECNDVRRRPYSGKERKGHGEEAIQEGVEGKGDRT